MLVLPTQDAGAFTMPEPSNTAAEIRAELWRRRGEQLVAMLVIVLWCALLLAGTVVDSEPYWRSISPAPGEAIALPHHVDRWSWAWIWFVTATCYTVSNIALLTILAGILGSLGRALRTDRRAGPSPSLGDTIFAGALQGLFAYVLLIAGFLFMVGEEGFLNTSQAQYIRLAGLASVFGFVLGHEPATFRRMLGGVRDRLAKPRDDGEGASSDRDPGVGP